MNYQAVMNAATMGRPERLRPLIGWTIAEYFFRGAPYGILLMVVWELFKPLQDPGTALDVKRVLYWCGAFFVSLILLYLISRKAYFSAYKDSYEICADGRLEIAEHLRKLSMGFYNTRDPGDIGAYIVSDYANIENLLSHQLPQICGALAAPLVLLACLSFISWKLALAAALVIPLAWPAAWVSFKIINHFGIKHQKYKVDSASRMIEYIQGIRLIKAFNLGGTKFDRLQKAFHRLKVQSIKLEAGSGPTVLLSSFVLNGGFTLIILFGFTLLLADEVALPVYIMFLILGSRIYEPLLHALIFMAELNYYKLGVDRVEALRQTKPLPEGNVEAKIVNHSIEFKDVSFSYHDAKVLNNFDLCIPEHALTALVGPSGSGKTTLTRLISRFWDVDAGEIRIGGKSIKAYTSDHLLTNISMVFQDVYLFNDTIYNNIRIGRPHVSREEIIAAAKMARCHDFVTALPEGYETMVGESGSTLSGGEKQRISIARALLKDAPIVLLDEATAALDPENELYIQAAIDELVKNKTVVVIAHRLNTISRADKIVVIDKGSIAEEGTHDDLMSRKGLYKALWDEQQRVKGWKF
ncbi:MsbA3: lipid A export ATP-binding/permease protein [Desulfosarcina variabilis str. Montpellier]|uniref:ABC transporter ATP-binding protein n=1 Tax=Desulfosarcina variabilis TaxID=2300 RepID=UPI003AFA291D